MCGKFHELPETVKDIYCAECGRVIAHPDSPIYAHPEPFGV